MVKATPGIAWFGARLKALITPLSGKLAYSAGAVGNSEPCTEIQAEIGALLQLRTTGFTAKALLKLFSVRD